MNIRPRVCWLVAVIVLLTACVTSPRRTDVVLDGVAQRDVIAGLDAWRLEGRVAVAAGSEGFNASLDWNQDGADSSVRLASPLGAGSLRLKFDDEHLHVETSRGQVLEGEEARGALQDQLGFAPPLEALRYWLLGLQAPGADAMEERNLDGQLLWLTQHGWRVEYQEFLPQSSAQGALLLPRRLRATREDLRLRVVIDSWRLDP